MIVLILSKVRPGFRGRLTRHLIQPHAGVFVGHASARIRERLWDSVRQEIGEKGGTAILIHPESNEQGYAIRMWGEPDRTVRDFDGLCLPKTRPKA